jgi:hypothetical protein
MTYFADLAPFIYLGRSAGDVRGVGWLEGDHDFVCGDVPPGVVTALEQLFLHAWQPVTAAGWHDCSLCGRKESDGPLTREIGGTRHLMGVANLLVPAGDVIYAAPSLIIHYIEDHRYRPPDAFLEALAAIDPAADAYGSECERIWYGG